MLKMQKSRGKVNFKTVWHLDQNEHFKKKLHTFIRTKFAKDYSKVMMFILGGHNKDVIVSPLP